MAPSSDDNIKNIGSAHLTTLVVLSNPRSCGQGLTIALDLHLLLKSPEGEAIEKTVLARLYNHTKISFTAPRVCFVSVSITSIGNGKTYTIGEAEVITSKTHDAIGEISSIHVVSPELPAGGVIEAGTVTPCLSPTVHLSLIVLTSNKGEYSFTGCPNPYNGFDRGSSFPVTVFLTNPRWNDSTKKMLTPSKGNAIKITGIISSVHPDSEGINHWVVTASEIFFLKDCLSPTKPAVPGTVRAGKPGKVFSYSNIASPNKRQRTDDGSSA